MLDDGFQRSLAHEYERPGEQPVRHASDRVKITPRVHRFSQRLFRRHERGGPAHDISPGKRLAFLVFPTAVFHQPKIQHLDEVYLAAIAAEIDIGRLDITMNQSRLMRLRQRAQQLPQEEHHPLGWKRPECPDQVIEVEPVQQQKSDD